MVGRDWAVGTSERLFSARNTPGCPKRAQKKTSTAQTMLRNLGPGNCAPRKRAGVGVDPNQTRMGSGGTSRMAETTRRFRPKKIGSSSSPETQDAVVVVVGSGIRIFISCNPRIAQTIFLPKNSMHTPIQTIKTKEIKEKA